MSDKIINIYPSDNEVIHRWVFVFKTSLELGEVIFDTLTKMDRGDVIQEITERYERKELVNAFWKKYNFLVEFKDSIYLDDPEFYQFYKKYFSSNPPSTYFSEFNKEAEAISFLSKSNDLSVEFSAEDLISVFDMINKLLLFEDEFFGERHTV